MKINKVCALVVSLCYLCVLQLGVMSVHALYGLIYTCGWRGGRKIGLSCVFATP